MFSIYHKYITHFIIKVLNDISPIIYVLNEFPCIPYSHHSTSINTSNWMTIQDLLRHASPICFDIIHG